MDLNLAMRYVMVQAQREAAGNSVKADHLFLGLLTLGKKNASDITPDAQVQSRISGDMQNVKNLFETHHISMDDTGEKLRFLLNVDPSQAETDASNLLLQAMDTCKQQGKTEVAASVVLELILKSPTTLIGKVLASPPVDKPQGIQKIFQITGESPKKAETVFQKNESVMPEPKPIPEPKPKPEPNAPVFFDMPKVGDAARHAPQNPPKPQKPYQPPKGKRRTEIVGIPFRGGVVWAAIQYFFWTIVIPIALLALMEYKWQLLSDPPSNKYLAGLPYFVLLLWVLFISYGIISLISRRLQAFAEFIYFLANIGLFALVIGFRMMIFQIDDFSKLYLAAHWVIVFSLLFYSLYRLNRLKNTSTGNSHNINSSMLRISGTPAIIFFTYLLRSLIIPILAASIISIFNLPINSFWRAAFFIFGFLWVWDVIRMIIQCNALRRDKNPADDFWLIQHIFLFLPELGLFLMWYFGWFPMRTWVIWVYCIYGLFWLSIIGNLLIMKKGK